MPLEPSTAELVRHTLEQALALDPELGERFYRRLFELSPDFRRLFRGDLQRQQRILTSTLALLVTDLEQAGQGAARLEQLGRAHRGYGVRAEHYVVFGEALAETLAHVLGPAFTPEVRQAWDQAFDLIIQRMTAPH